MFNTHKLFNYINCKLSVNLASLIISSFLFGCGWSKKDKQFLPTQNQVLVSESAVNINTASAIELEKLPRIGPTLAQKIVEHREKFGKFRKTEFLMQVDGISDKRFREIKNLIKVE